VDFIDEEVEQGKKRKMVRVHLPRVAASAGRYGGY
jgi:hypothetical protein